MALFDDTGSDLLLIINDCIVHLPLILGHFAFMECFFFFFWLNMDLRLLVIYIYILTFHLVIHNFLRTYFSSPSNNEGVSCLPKQENNFEKETLNNLLKLLN